MSNELCDGISESKRVHSERFVVDCGLWQMLLDSGQALGAKMGTKDYKFCFSVEYLEQEYSIGGEQRDLELFNFDG